MSTLISILFIVLLGWALLAPLAIPAAWRMLRRQGRSGWPSLLLLVPYLGMVALMLILQGAPRAASRPSSGMVGLAHR